MGRVLIIWVRLTIIVWVVEGAVLVGSRSEYHNPFAAYESIMPGQPSANLENYSCNIYKGAGLTISCIFALKEGSFDSVMVEYNHVIKRIVFRVRSVRLRLSDLILCWGKPASVTPDYRLYEMGRTDVHWSKGLFANIIADHQNVAHLNYLLPISYVSIEDEWRPCRAS